MCKANNTPEQNKTCSGCIDEFVSLHDDLGIANCGMCIRNQTIKDYYQAKDNFNTLTKGGKDEPGK